MSKWLTRKAVWPFLILANALLLSGCGSPSVVKVKGQVLKAGQPFLPPKGEVLHVIFYPYTDDGSLPENYFPANVRPQDGTFKVPGVDGKGIPPGKYRISVQLLRGEKDQMKGAYGREKTPFVRDITGQDVPLDLDNPGG